MTEPLKKNLLIIDRSIRVSRSLVRYIDTWEAKQLHAKAIAVNV